MALGDRCLEAVGAEAVDLADVWHQPGQHPGQAEGLVGQAKYPQYYGDDAGSSNFHPFWCLRPTRVYAWSLSNFPRQATRFDF